MGTLNETLSKQVIRLQAFVFLVRNMNNQGIGVRTFRGWNLAFTTVYDLVLPQPDLSYLVCALA